MTRVAGTPVKPGRENDRPVAWRNSELVMFGPVKGWPSGDFNELRPQQVMVEMHVRTS